MKQNSSKGENSRKTAYYAWAVAIGFMIFGEICSKNPALGTAISVALGLVIGAATYIYAQGGLSK